MPLGSRKLQSQENASQKDYDFRDLTATREFTSPDTMQYNITGNRPNVVIEYDITGDTSEITTPLTGNVTTDSGGNATIGIAIDQSGLGSGNTNFTTNVVVQGYDITLVDRETTQITERIPVTYDIDQNFAGNGNVDFWISPSVSNVVASNVATITFSASTDMNTLNDPVHTSMWAISEIWSTYAAVPTLKINFYRQGPRSYTTDKLTGVTAKMIGGGGAGGWPSSFNPGLTITQGGGAAGNLNTKTGNITLYNSEYDKSREPASPVPPDYVLLLKCGAGGFQGLSGNVRTGYPTNWLRQQADEPSPGDQPLGDDGNFLTQDRLGQGGATAITHWNNAPDFRPKFDGAGNPYPPEYYVWYRYLNINDDIIYGTQGGGTGAGNIHATGTSGQLGTQGERPVVGSVVVGGYHGGGSAGLATRYSDGSLTRFRNSSGNNGGGGKQWTIDGLPTGQMRVSGAGGGAGQGSAGANANVFANSSYAEVIAGDGGSGVVDSDFGNVCGGGGGYANIANPIANTSITLGSGSHGGGDAGNNATTFGSGGGANAVDFQSGVANTEILAGDITIPPSGYHGAIKLSFDFAPKREWGS